MIKFLKYTLGGILLICTLVFVILLYSAWQHNLLSKPVYDTIAPDLSDFRTHAENKPRILLFSKTNGFRHIDSLPAAKKMFAEFAKNEDWAMYETENAAIHNTTDLSTFDLIIWNNVSGDILTKKQRTEFKTYMENGGQLLAIHASGGDPAYDWQWHPQSLIKAPFTGHPMKSHFQDGALKIEDQTHPALQHLPTTWIRHDEWYSFEASPRAQVNVLISLDEASYSPSTWGRTNDLSMGGDHPMVWYHNIGKGRVFYSALGHTPESYVDESFRVFMKNASLWLLR